MTISYPIIIKIDGNDYNVVFPDLLGVVTFGYSINEAIEMAKDALKEAYLSNMLEGCKPSSLSKIKELFPNNLSYLISIEI